ncbi:MAG: response regulator transcription factor [Candidatus Yonathbacteria bacterium]|nr:response regulator transcription factor [Candidatus Yonathbacteria bacterium]
MMPPKNKKILVVEDEEPLRRVLKDILMYEGYDVLEAVNGIDGLDTAQSKHPDLILLDIVMPRMDGLMMLQKLRDSEWGKTALVMILTNLSDNDEVIKETEAEGIDYFVKTDIKINEVVAKINAKLG